MYLKLINQRGDGDRIIEIGTSVELGSVPYWPDRDGGPASLPPTQVGLDLLIERIGVEADSWDRTLIYEEPFGYKDGEIDDPFWKLRWARYDTDEGIKVVVNTGSIYLLGETGKTIDRTP